MRHRLFIIVALVLVVPFFPHVASATTNTNSGQFVRSSSNYTGINNNLGITGGTITMEAWVRPASQPGANVNWGIVHQGSTTNLNEYAIRYIADGAGTKKIRVTRTRSGVADLNLDYTVTLAVGTWYHLVLTYDGTDLKLFTAVQGGTHTEQVSGTQTGAGAGWINPDFLVVGTYLRENSSGDSYATSIGSIGTSIDNPFDGLIDDVRIWNTARSAGQMDADFETELTGSETGLVAYYQLNNAWTDLTANAFTLTTYNGPTFSALVPFTGIVASAATSIIGLVRAFWLY